MIRRAIITAILVLTPAVALADDAATLGPSTSGAGGTSDPATSSLLQPAGTSSLQSSGEQGSGITQAPSDSNLQPAGTADANQSLLVTEAAGTQHDLADTTANISWPLFAGLGAFFVLGMLGLLVTENRRLAKLNTTDDTPEPNVATEESPTETESDPEPSPDSAEDEKTADVVSEPEPAADEENPDLKTASKPVQD